MQTLIRRKKVGYSHDTGVVGGIGGMGIVKDFNLAHNFNTIKATVFKLNTLVQCSPSQGLQYDQGP